MSDLAFYHRAAREYGQSPALEERAYVDEARRQQRAIKSSVDGGYWTRCSWAESFTAMLVEELGRCHLFVDVGAGAGFYTFLALKHMPADGRVIAIEPDPVRCELLRELLLPCDKVDVVEWAVSDHEGVVTLVKPRGCSATCADVEGQKFEVPTLVLDEFLQDIPVDVIKIDVEGSEADVFNGMRNLLMSGTSKIFLEYHPWIDAVRPGGVALLHRLLAEADYRIYRTADGRLSRSEKLGGRVYLVPQQLD